MRFASLRAATFAGALSLIVTGTHRGVAQRAAQLQTEVKTAGDTVFVINRTRVEALPVLLQTPTVVRVWPGDSLNRPTQIAVGDDGCLFVADRTRVFVLSSSGALLGVVGRGGRGPGEFHQIHGIALLAEDTVLVWDGDLRRLTWLTRAGTVVRTEPVRPPAGTQGPRALPLLVTAFGIMLAWAPGMVRPDGPPDTVWVFVHHPGSGARAALVAAVEDVSWSMLGGMGSPKNPYGSRALVSAAGGRVATSTGVDYEIRVVRMDTLPQRVIRRVWPRRPSSERAPLPSDAGRDLGRSGEPLARVIAAQQYGDLKNSIEEMLLMVSGRLWVRPVDSTYRYHPYYLARLPSLRPPAFLWEIFDSAGVVTGRAYLSSLFHPQVVRHCAMYGFLDEDDGTKSVARVDLPSALCEAPVTGR